MINIFILCYNEEVLIEHTILHYKNNFPNCNITIFDNESTDNSVKLATNLECKIISWNSNNHIDDFKYQEIKNNCWKNIKEGWIIMIDMDEWLCIKEEELEYEKQNGTTIITTKGFEVVGESIGLDLKDINLHKQNKGFHNDYESKYVCFLREKIDEMNYGIGAHKANPTGIINYSKDVYRLKHMAILGLEFYKDKQKKRYKRAGEMRKKGCTGYLNSDYKINENYIRFLNLTKEFTKDDLK